MVLLYVNEEHGLARRPLAKWPAITDQPRCTPSDQSRVWSKPSVLTLPSVILQGIKVWLNVRQCLMPGIRLLIRHFTGSRMFHETLKPLALICLLLVAGPLSAADRLVDGVPLPEDPKAAILAETDPTELRQWAGAWVGAWGG